MRTTAICYNTIELTCTHEMHMVLQQAKVKHKSQAFGIIQILPLLEALNQNPSYRLGTVVVRNYSAERLSTRPMSTLAVSETKCT